MLTLAGVEAVPALLVTTSWKVRTALVTPVPSSGAVKVGLATVVLLSSTAGPAVWLQA